MAKSEETPLMQQWREAKSRHPDALIFFRVGDFYEMFCEDAEEGARLLGLTLTSRNNGGAANVPLAGVPVRARDEYLERLIRLGRRVAVCEQVEDPAEAKGIVRREVVETITPGALLSDTLLSERRNNFLVALARADQQHLALCAVDASNEPLRGARVRAEPFRARRVNGRVVAHLVAPPLDIDDVEQPPFRIREEHRAYAVRETEEALYAGERLGIRDCSGLGHVPSRPARVVLRAEEQHAG